MYRLHVETSAGNRVIYGHYAVLSGYTNGVYGQSDSSSGTGVVGYAIAASVGG